jgi:DUF1016 N-terminal domain
MNDVLRMSENYNTMRAGIVEVLQAVRVAAARNVNSIMTAAYWEIGRRIVHSEQRGESRADYGKRLIKQLATDLSKQFGRGFGSTNLK